MTKHDTIEIPEDFGDSYETKGGGVIELGPSFLLMAIAIIVIWFG